MITAESFTGIDKRLLHNCVHCDEPVLVAYYNDKIDPQKKMPFCCAGCLTVFDVLSEKGLDEYYQIKKISGLIRRRSPVNLTHESYGFIDSQDFINEYSYLNAQNLPTMQFYVEGVHCLACLWLIEKLPSLVPETIYAKLDIEKSVVTVSITNKGQFSQIAQELRLLGYRPHAINNNQDAYFYKQKEERLFLLRIGVAGAGASNAMLYAISNYAGATSDYSTLFHWLTLLFAIPVMSFSAYPFYKNAWNSLRTKTLSIDIPICLSLILGICFGLWSLLNNSFENYFDSLSSLVFLLLISRYFLKKIQDRALSSKDLHFFYQTESVSKKILDNKWESIHPKYIAVNDIIRINKGDFFPADCILLEDKTYVNQSLLTGEFIPVLKNNLDEVYSGTQNISQDVVVQVKKIKTDTKLGKILKEVESGWTSRAPILNLTDRISHFFILVVCILAALVFLKFYHQGKWHQGLEQAITLLIITCPCALALAVPLSFTKALNDAARNGIIVKNDIAIQKLSEIKSLYFDKTGTLTFGEVEITNMNIRKMNSNNKINLNDLANIVLTLENHSKHPYALALVEWAKKNGGKILNGLEEFNEIPGIGVFGSIDNQKYSITKDGIGQGDLIIATFDVQEILKPDSIQEIKNLKELNLNLNILSGDSSKNVLKVSRLVGLTEQNTFFEKSPEEKSEIIKNSKFSMMVGDGANDAIAFSNAHVGVAVLGSMDLALRAADVYLSVPGLSSIRKLIILGRETMLVIKRNLFLSLLYNLISVVFAFHGLINPLLAAIIMPISSLSVSLSTIVGTKKLRALWKS